MPKKYIKPKPSDVVSDAVLYCVSGCCTATVLSVVVDPEGVSRAVIYAEDGDTLVTPVHDVVEMYRIPWSHKLSSGDIFVFEDEKGENPYGATFLYVSDDTVLRFAGLEKLGGYYSYCDLDFYVNKVAHGNYDMINVVSNIRYSGAIIKQS